MANPTLLATAIARIEALARRGMVADAEQACVQLVQQQPGEHQAWAWLGVLRLVSQRYADAEQALRQAIMLHGDDAQYWTNASLALRVQGKAGDAEAFARQAVALEPAKALHWGGLAGALFDQRRYEEAASAYREALARDATSAAAWSELGAAEHNLGHAEAALEAYERSLSLAPGNFDATTKYALLLVDRGQAEQALSLLQPVVQQAPQMTLAWLALGRAYRLLDDQPQAEAALRRAVQLDPRSREARHDLALVLLSRAAHLEAEAIVRTLLADEPAFAEAWLLLGVALHAQARIDEALPALRRALELAPTPLNHSKLLVSLQYADGVTPGALLAEHRAWNAAFARPLLTIAPPVPPGISGRAAGQPLRLGLVASDFCAGPTGFLALSALEHLDRARCSLACYSDRLREDDYTARFRAIDELWRPTIGVSDEDLARQIRADQIEVLIDLAGHVGARLLTFARKSAPLQVTWLGYVGTTGLDAMDCLLADRHHVRQGEEPWYAEQVLRMPHGYACYGPPPITPEVRTLPALATGSFTFGCFNNTAKITTDLLDLWARILRRAPAARLLLKSAGLDDPRWQSQLRARFAQRGVAMERIILEGRSPHAELVASYNRVDLALDTQPYSGGLTTCEALWMGVPVVTFPGQTFAGRHSVSHLTTAGYPQFIAADAAGYVELAVQWAGRLLELATLRATMRERVRQSPLCDAPRFARDLLALLQQAWQARIARES